MFLSQPGEIFSLNRTGWLFEPKLDGFRAIAEIENGQVIIYSRGQNVLSYPSIAAELQKINDPMILDGEIVMLDDQGKPDRPALLRYSPRYYNPNNPPQLFYYVFDLLYVAGRDIRTLPLETRKLLLAQTIPNLTNIHPCLYYMEDGTSLAEVALAWQLEGIVAKKTDSLYFSGKRSRDWVKIKYNPSQQLQSS